MLMSPGLFPSDHQREGEHQIPHSSIRMLGVGTSDECVSGRITDGMFGYLIKNTKVTIIYAIYWLSL